jgi:hypothetical protein
MYYMMILESAYLPICNVSKLMYTRTSLTYPAAVTCPVMNLPKWFEASSTALYPAMFAMELVVGQPIFVGSDFFKNQP